MRINSIKVLSRSHCTMMFSRRLTMGKSNAPCVIGVSGGTASGKSLVTEKIMEKLEVLRHNKQVITIHLESFYRELSPTDVEKVASGEYDFDHPSAFDFDLLTNALESLERGESVDIPKYDFMENKRNGVIHLQPADVVIVEGILIFYDEKLRNKFAMKLFVDADADIRLARRVRRDTLERMRPLSLVLSTYTKKVKPAFEEFCQPTKKHADVIIPRGGENDVAIDLLVQHIQDLLRTPRGSPEIHKNGKRHSFDSGDTQVRNRFSRPH